MKLNSERKAIVALGAAAVILLVHLIVQIGSIDASRGRVIVHSVRPRFRGTIQKVSLKTTKTTKTAKDLTQLDPVLRLDELKELLARPAPKMDRNPFEFAPTPQEIRRIKEEASKPPAPPPPPPPPPLPLQAVGFSDTGKGKQAYITDQQETYIVGEGDEFGGKYKVLKITATQVEVEDESSHQNVQLLIPQ